MQPKQIRETLSPDFPNRTYCIAEAYPLRMWNEAVVTGVLAFVQFRAPKKGDPQPMLDEACTAILGQRL
jgi:hypothetical protein